MSAVQVDCSARHEAGQSALILHAQRQADAHAEGKVMKPEDMSDDPQEFIEQLTAMTRADGKAEALAGNLGYCIMCGRCMPTCRRCDVRFCPPCATDACPHSYQVFV